MSDTNIIVIGTFLPRQRLRELAEQRFGDMVKAVVDLSLEKIALGGELHADEEAVLLEQGSAQKDLWGINIYIDKADEERIEFDSMINIRPSQNNRSRSVEDLELQKQIVLLVNKLIE